MSGPYTPYYQGRKLTAVSAVCRDSGSLLKLKLVSGSMLQMLGRGLRISPGKKDCVVIDFTDKVHNPNRLFDARKVRVHGVDWVPSWQGSSEMPGLCVSETAALIGSVRT